MSIGMDEAPVSWVLVVLPTSVWDNRHTDGGHMWRVAQSQASHTDVGCVC